ncbi:hypothetical protein LJB86_03365 [Deltaproteobacteria bacterium OttesenSCG-928-M10]|nr:hypothetical protein [Deltaproteobacteria bacterium OttesenSCG-928-M10]
MSEKCANIIIAAGLAAAGGLMVFLAAGGQTWALYALGAIGGLLALQLRHLVRLHSRRNVQAEDGRADFQVSSDSLLNWDELSKNFDDQTRRLLRGSLNQGLHNSAALRGNLEEALPRLARLARRHPRDPGPPALKAHALVLLSRLAGREQPELTGTRYIERRKWNAGLEMLDRALHLAPDNAFLEAEAGRLLEERITLSSASEEDTAYYLSRALGHYEKAVNLDPDLAVAWRNRGRILLRLSEAAPEDCPLESLLVQAAECYEMARRQPEWDGAFYLEFGRAVRELAQARDERKLHYFNYAARLFALAGEKNPLDSEPLFQTGKALFLAAEVYEEMGNPEKAVETHQQALDQFKKAARLNPTDLVSRVRGARTLAALFKLKSGREGQPTELLSEAIGLCAQAALIAEAEEVYSEWADILSLLADSCPERAGRLWADAAEKYGLAAGFDNVPPDRAVINWHNWAYSLTCQAQGQPSAAGRRALFQEALAKYRRAAELNSDNLITLKNTGEVLAELALLEPDRRAAEELNRQSAEYFQKAAELHPDQAGPWRRWSQALVVRARAERNPVRRRALWQEAINKLERGARAQADEALIWALWGRVLSELMWESPEYERPLLAAGAMEKYETALKLDPDDDETWSHLGQICLEAAELSEECVEPGGSLAGAMAAADHFQTACSLNPHQAGHWAEWGRAHFKIAQIMDNEASSLAALKESHDKYETAVALAPDNYDYRACLCRVLYQWGWRLDEPDQQRERFSRAYEHCREAGRLSPHDPMVWRDWGRIIEALAGIESDPRKSADWQREADEKYYRAGTLESTDDRSRRH